LVALLPLEVESGAQLSLLVEGLQGRAQLCHSG
jgi:hypothetical protein